jgi:hypothetical protein
MHSYARNSLKEFGRNMKAPEMKALIEIARGKTSPCRPGDGRSYIQIQADLISDEIGVPSNVIAKALNAEDHKAMAAVINIWLQEANVLERFTAICDALLARTESPSSDTRWANGFARQVAQVFNVPIELGLATMETPAEPGKRWGLLVARATALRILTVSA